MFDYDTLKSWLFKLRPEDAHHLAEFFLRLPNVIPSAFASFTNKHFITNPTLKQNIFDVDFLNPIGIGAGFDKNATMIRGMHALGFGFTEIGTVTLKPQNGNTKPRMFRHIRENSLQNAMGFNNDGLFKVMRRLKKRYPYTTPIGVNIGKNKKTSQRDTLSEYITIIKAVHHLSDYLVINISSPNTPGLRDLQNTQFVSALFSQVKEITNKPILLKIAPDMSHEQAVDLTSLAVEKGAKGIIATNTTIDYSLVKNPQAFGGLSGEVLTNKSFEIFKAISKELFGKTILISTGGISCADEAYKRIRHGASLVEIYTGLIFKGPELVKEINLELTKLLQADGYTNITDAIGIDIK